MDPSFVNRRGAGEKKQKNINKATNGGPGRLERSASITKRLWSKVKGRGQVIRRLRKVTQKNNRSYKGGPQKTGRVCARRKRRKKVIKRENLLQLESGREKVKEGKIHTMDLESTAL